MHYDKLMNFDRVKKGGDREKKSSIHFKNYIKHEYFPFTISH